MSTLLFSEHLTKVPSHAVLERTHVGQAHLAGTGPCERTCRECKHWHNVKAATDQKYHEYRRGDGDVMHLQPARCRYPIANKANRRIPHDAEACRFFEAAESTPPVERESRRERKKQ